MAQHTYDPTRRTGSPLYRTNGAAAYDIYRQSNEDGNAARQLPKPRRHVRPRPRPKAKLAVAPLGMVGFLAAAMMLVFVICGYVQLFEETTAVNQLQNKISDAQNYQAHLQAIYDSKIDLDVIQAQAAQLGMTMPTSAQTVYLNLQGTDRAVITDRHEENVAQTAWTAIVRSIHTLMEYFARQ